MANHQVNFIFSDLDVSVQYFSIRWHGNPLKKKFLLLLQISHLSLIYSFS
jgi:hypothetical protein